MISQRIVGLRVNQPFIAQITTMLLLGGLGCQLGVMTWRVGEMVFPPAPPREHNVRPASAPPARVLSTLFVPRQQAERSAVTLSSLNVRLAAVIASSQPENALIVLEQGGQQTSYGINEMISGTQARVQAIYADRVELSNGGHVEALRLDDNADARQPQEPAATRAELAKNPARLLDFVSVSPVNKAGTLQGYRLNPGKEAAIFQQSGLQPNDLAIAINGFDLRIPEQAAKFMAQAGDLTQLSVTVLRDDAEKNIFVDLSVKTTE